MQIDKLQYISQSMPQGGHLQAIANVLAAGVRWVQLRAKDCTQKDILTMAMEARQLCEHYGAKLIINDHPLIAMEAKAHGIHLGLSDMSVSKARTLAGPDMIIGGTANTFEHITQRVAEGADYIGLGPYRFTNTKQNLSPILGVEGCQSIMTKVKQAGYSIPIVAIGGIGLNDIRCLMQAELHGVALSGALTNRPDLNHITGQILNELEVNNLSINRKKYVANSG